MADDNEVIEANWADRRYVFNGAELVELTPEQIEQRSPIDPRLLFQIDDKLIVLTEEQYAARNPPRALTVKDYEDALERLFNETAQAKRYDNRITCALRAGYPGPFQAEGMAFAVWMDECNGIAYGMLQQYEAGEIAAPSIEGMLAMLPEIEWPAA